MEGSEKQIAWAAKIRNGFMPKAKEALERNSKAPFAKEWYDWFVSQTNASYWIDIRDDTIREIVKNWYETTYTKKEA